MREIIFRGKRIINGDWVYGNLFIPDRHDSQTQILIGTDVYRIPYDIIPDTVGQYTGLTDKNGKKIFEGDIVKSFEYDDIYLVKYFDNNNYPAFDCVPDVPFCECNGLSFLVNTEGCEVIGNIHDNPELMNREEDENVCF